MKQLINYTKQTLYLFYHFMIIKWDDYKDGWLISKNLFQLWKDSLKEEVPTVINLELDQYCQGNLFLIAPGLKFFTPYDSHYKSEVAWWTLEDLSTWNNY